jgi:hypothetical protein
MSPLSSVVERVTCKLDYDEVGCSIQPVGMPFFFFFLDFGRYSPR